MFNEFFVPFRDLFQGALYITFTYPEASSDINAVEFFRVAPYGAVPTGLNAAEYLLYGILHRAADTRAPFQYIPEKPRKPFSL